MAIVVFGSCQSDLSGPGANTSVVVTPSEATVRAGETVQLTATLEDENGNPQPTPTVTWTSSDLAVAAVSSSGVVTGGAVGGPVTITAAVGSSSDRASVTVVNGPPSQLTVATQPATAATSGWVFETQPEIVVRDVVGNPVPGASVTASVVSGDGSLMGNVTVTSAGDGVATFTDLGITGAIGDHRLAFTAGSASIDSETITVVAGPPTTLRIVTQPSSTAQSGVAFARQPAIAVEDELGNPAEGVEVTAAVASGGGTVSGGTTAVTDGSGVATFADLGLSGTAGDHTLSFTVGSSSIVSDTITLEAGTAASVVILTQPPDTAQNDVEFSPQPSVEVLDDGGNPVAGVSVGASIAAGGGVLNGTVNATTDAAGQATFTDLSITGTIGERTLQFTSGETGATSDPIELEAGPLAELVITQQPSSTAVNAEPFPQQPTIRAEDVSDNPISGVDVTAAIASGGGTLGGTVTLATDASGVAAFTGLSITGTVGSRRLEFSNSGVQVTSNTIDLIAGEPTSVAILTQPPEFTVSGVTFSQSPVVEVRDVSDNPVPSVDVTVAIGSGTATLGGTTTLTTAGSGSATFMDLSLTGDLGANALLFSSNSVQATSDPVNVSYGEGFYQDVPYCGTQLLDVYAPDNSFPRPVPIAVYVHGGAWVNRDKQTGVFLDPVTDTLVNRGYLVVSINYRLATASTNEWPAQIHDVKCAVRHLRAEAGDYGFDGVRIGVWGDSAGGHLAALLGLTDADDGTFHGLEGNEGYPEESSRVAAAAAIAAITDMSEPQAPDHNELSLDPVDVFETWPGPSQELDEASPIWWTTSDDPPFLIIHGDEDTTVDHAQAVRLRDNLSGVGGTVTLLTVQNGGHELQDVGMGTPSPTVDEVAQEIADFLDIHVRFNP